MTVEEITAYGTGIVAVVGAVSMAGQKLLGEWRQLRESLDGPEGEDSLREILSKVTSTQQKHGETLDEHTDLLHQHSRKLRAIEPQADDAPPPSFS